MRVRGFDGMSDPTKVKSSATAQRPEAELKKQKRVYTIIEESVLIIVLLVHRF